MELICPSCEARYQVPGGSIGEKGRQVSCMNCGHSWHAYPPLVLGTTETAPSPSRGLTYPGGHTPQRPTGPKPVLVDPEETTSEKKTPQLAGDSAPPSVRADQSRSEQLAEIREMLAEVQSEDRAAAVLAPVAPARPAEPEAKASSQPKAPEPEAPPRESLTAGVQTSSSEAHEVDPRIAAESRRKQEDLRNQEEAADRERASREQNRGSKAKPTDVKKLTRSHTRRIRREKARAKAGSGAFLTGLLLVAIIAAVMIALYILHPQIIERMPGTEDALLKYVATIDGVRVSLAETFGGLQEWVSSALSDKEEG